MDREIKNALAEAAEHAIDAVTGAREMVEELRETGQVVDTDEKDVT